ncbi:hypothetical protein [Streptomyces sp. NPDC056670]|uniref:hypothetical protein n=1 Tax=Streptomyces sp. NPDC056670 TaxID=3345904 RepID=UPI0036C7474A
MIRRIGQPRLAPTGTVDQEGRGGTDGLIGARTADGSTLGEEGLTGHLSAHATRGADSPPATVYKLLTDLGTGVSDGTALLALPVPPHRTPPPAQENR